MKIALVHELLTMRGGAERVLKVLADMFPDAPIYTLLYDEKKLGDWFPRARVRPAKIPLPYSLLPTPYRFNHHFHLRWFPKAVEAWDFFDFDLVISSSSAFTHGIITNGKPKHLCYVQSPARYLWDRTHDVQKRAPWITKSHLSRLFHDLRIWDSEAAGRPDQLIAASKEVQRRIELYWRRESEIIYPPVDDAWLSHTPSSGTTEHSDYLLIVSTLVPYKRIDLAIEACGRAKKHLKIVGEGPDRRRLERMAGPTVEFYGYRSNDELQDLFAKAKAVLFPGEEDLGLVPLEAMALGTPVVAYGKGGALETVIEGETGEFFTEPTVESFVAAIDRAEKKTFEKSKLRTRAEEFSRKRFEKEMNEMIQKMMVRG
jgi:glycosyltransferase involved in cell wall biosynthesis